MALRIGRGSLGLVATAALLLGAAAPVGAGPVTAGERSVPSRDVTTTDADLGSTAREVVVVTTEEGRPEVRKLRADSKADAAALERSLGAQPGVTAEPNTTFALPVGARSITSGGTATTTITAATSSPATAPSEGAPAGSTRAMARLRTMAAAGPEAEQFGASQWGLAALHVGAAWAMTRGSGTRVAIIDTGVDASHPDLAGRLAAPQTDLVGDGQVGDPHGHGTFLAGIVGAKQDRTGVVGVAPAASLLSFRVLDAQGEGDAASVANGILAAVDAGADVLNLSLGAPSNSPAVAQAVAYAVQKGATVVAAGGNERQDGNPTTYPAALPGVLAVTGVGASGYTSRYCNTGPYIDLGAPGEDILSTLTGGGWAYAEGSSLATAFASGVAALVRSANPALERAQVDDALVRSARDDPWRAGRDDVFGYGVVQADRAVLRAVMRVQVSRAGYGDQLAVDVDPDLASGAYSLQAQRRAADGTWTTLPDAYSTQGTRETRTLTLGAGDYRVVVAGRDNLPSVASRMVTLTRPTLRVRVTKAGYGDRLAIDVDPGRGPAAWSFRVQRRSPTGTWGTVTSGRTEGSAETRTLALGPGVYRVVVGGGDGYLGATSASVTLTPRTVRVTAARSGYGDRLAVDVDPSRGSGSWTFSVQRRSSTGTWGTVSSYRTWGVAEARTLVLGPGTFRVVVPAAHGYRGARSAEVKLTRPTARVRARTDAEHHLLTVDVDPAGSGQWTFVLQEQTAWGGWVALPTSYTTQGTARTRSFTVGQLHPGTFRAVVGARYGYLAATSSAAKLLP